MADKAKGRRAGSASNCRDASGHAILTYDSFDHIVDLRDSVRDVQGTSRREGCGIQRAKQTCERVIINVLACRQLLPAIVQRLLIRARRCGIGAPPAYLQPRRIPGDKVGCLSSEPRPGAEIARLLGHCAPTNCQPRAAPSSSHNSTSPSAPTHDTEAITRQTGNGRLPLQDFAVATGPLRGCGLAVGLPEGKSNPEPVTQLLISTSSPATTS
jgi:hypothetical protein